MVFGVKLDDFRFPPFSSDLSRTDFEVKVFEGGVGIVAAENTSVTGHSSVLTLDVIVPGIRFGVIVPGTRFGDEIRSKLFPCNLFGDERIFGLCSTKCNFV